jgi:hypothetical protein
MESSNEEKKTNEADKIVYDYLYDIKYSKILCGKGQSVALININPFLLIWGYNHHNAWGFPNLFHDDKPLSF